MDTGAPISGIKHKHIEEKNISYSKKRSSTINGVGGRVEAIGYVFLSLEAEDEIFEQKFCF